MKFKKIITILMTMIIVISNILSANISMATFSSKDLKIQTNKEYNETLAYGNAKLRFVYSFYINEQGKEQPVYCLDKSRPGVGDTDEKSYMVSVNEKIDNDKIWRILHYSYPYISITDMGCDNKYQCYVVTQSALYCVLYDWDVNKYKALNSEGETVITAIKNLMNYANNESIKPNSSKIEIKEIDNWNLEKVNETIYLSRTFVATSPYLKQNYTIGLRGYVPIGTLITDMNNEEKREFEPNEQFKILIPRTQVNGQNKINIEANSELSTFPIYRGEPNGELQPYAITGITTEDGKGQKDITYGNIGGTLIINKLDSYTNEPLEGANFKVSDSNGNVIIENETTGKNGQIKIFNLLQGTYYIEEIKSPEGYQKIVGKLEIPVFNNSTSTMKVMNTKTEIKKDETHNVIVEVVENNTEITNKVENDYIKKETENTTENNIEINNKNTTTEKNTNQNNQIQDNTKQNNKIQNNINTSKKLPKTGM